MKKQDTGIKDEQAITVESVRSKRKRWPLAIAAIVLVGLVIGLSIAARTQLGKLPTGQTQRPVPGRWEEVLPGFAIGSVVAAPSDPAVLYACASHRTLSTPSSTRVPVAIYTVLRSSDFGTHWQNVGEQLNLVVLCNIAVDAGDANNLYVAGESTNYPPPAGQRAGVLMHSTDGGQSWNAIHPSLKRPGESSAEPWYAEEMALEGNSFFGLTFQTGDGLASSTDGGRHWNVPRGQFGDPQKGIYSYAVDPANPRTIYELVDRLWAGDPSLNSVELYKTIDGGTTWQLLRKNVPLGNQVFVAGGKPEIVYIIGALGPLGLSTPGPPRSHPQQTLGFNLQISNDGGRSWRDVLIPEQLSETEHWSVVPAGRIYAYNGQCSGEITGHPTPGTTPETHCTSVLQSYDPNANKWSDLPGPPVQGIFVGATPTGSGSGAVLWFAGRTNGQIALYRYVV